jgi:hypothetical protein
VSGETSSAASPIIFTRRTGGRARSIARSVRRPATAPSPAGAIASPSSVKPTRSAKQTVTSVPPARRPEAGVLGAADDLGADLLALVDGEHVLEERPQLTPQLLDRLPIAQCGIDLGVALLEERVREHPLHGRREQRHPVPHDTRDLEQPVVGQSRLAKSLDHLGRLDVRIGADGVAPVRARQSERAAQRAQVGLLDARALCDLGDRVARAVLAGERSLEWEQAQTVALDRVPQLLDGSAVARQLTDQTAARFALALVGQAVEQAFRLWIDVVGVAPSVDRSWRRRLRASRESHWRPCRAAWFCRA